MIRNAAVRHSIMRLSVLIAIACAVLLAAEPDGANEPQGPVQLTAEQDHQRMLDLLGIKSLRKGADGRNPQAPNAANYDESRANPYPNLPDPLRLNNGQKV